MTPVHISGVSRRVGPTARTTASWRPIIDQVNATPAVLGGYRAHAHLWALFDGTPAHAAPGRLVYDQDGRVACHLCGRLFDQLGPHLRTHGWTAARYRHAVGLAARDPLGRDESDHLSQRERERRHRDSRLRARRESDEPAAG